MLSLGFPHLSQCRTGESPFTDARNTTGISKQPTDIVPKFIIREGVVLCDHTHVFMDINMSAYVKATKP